MLRLDATLAVSPRINTMVFRGLTYLLLCWFVCFGQDPAELFERAPPDVDKALRGRIGKFYQAHVDGKFREAYELVAEDSKDAFFAADKRRCRSFHIMKLEYSDNFTRAKALVTCDTDMQMLMGDPVSVRMPMTNLWKFLDGQWYWYVKPPTARGQESPLGLPSRSAGKSTPSAGLPPNLPDLAGLSELVKSDKEEVQLNPSTAGTDRVVITNQMPGSISLSFESVQTPGIDLKLDHTGLKAGESAVLSIRYEPSAGHRPSNTLVQIVVSPSQQVIPIRITFTAPSSAPDGN